MTSLSDPQAQLQQPPTSVLPPVPFQPPLLPQGQPVLQNSFLNVAQLGVQTILTPSISALSMEEAPGAPLGNTMQHMQSLPTEKITKKLLPEEHLILKTTFEALIQRCLSSATDPQTKRNLDDANKRLEFLYDKFRDQTLSPMIISGLHNIARSIETRNYTEGLNIHPHREHKQLQRNVSFHASAESSPHPSQQTRGLTMASVEGKELWELA